MPVAIDTAAYALARAIADEMGWRASEIYQFIVSLKAFSDDATIQQALEIMMALAIEGDDFETTRARFVDIATENKEA